MCMRSRLGHGGRHFRVNGGLFEIRLMLVFVWRFYLCWTFLFLVELPVHVTCMPPTAALEPVNGYQLQIFHIDTQTINSLSLILQSSLVQKIQE